MKMRAAGMGQTAMAKFLGVTESTVRYYLRKYGLPTQLDTAYLDDKTVDEFIKAWNRQVRAA